MTNEQIWAQSTVAEKCEVLKARLDRMERWQRGDQGVFDGLFNDLARRVADCENDGHRMRELSDRITKRELVEVSQTPTGAHVDVLELARLRRIEEAAREFAVDADLMGVSWDLVRQLRAALDSEPER